MQLHNHAKVITQNIISHGTKESLDSTTYTTLQDEIYIFHDNFLSIPPDCFVERNLHPIVCTLFSFFLILSNEIAARRISGIFMIKNSSPVLR